MQGQCAAADNEELALGLEGGSWQPGRASSPIVMKFWWEISTQERRRPGKRQRLAFEVSAVCVAGPGWSETALEEEEE